MKPTNIFISYSHKNSKEFEELYSHLLAGLPDHKITAWSDKEIEVGGIWKNEINIALQNANIGLLLVSVGFLTSSFIRDVEIPTLLDQNRLGKTIIFPVILEECAWKPHEWLSKFQVWNNGEAIWKENNTKPGRYSKLTQLVYDIIEKTKKVETDKKRLTVNVLEKESEINFPLSVLVKSEAKLNPAKLDVALSNEGVLLESGINPNVDTPFVGNASLLQVLAPPINRDESSSVYTSISAPTGYGKTRILKRLYEMYKEKGWNCGFAVLDSGKGIKVLAKSLVINLGIPSQGIRIKENLGKDFFRLYKENNKTTNKPLALFIDTLGNVTKDDIVTLDKNFVEDLDNCIFADEHLSKPGMYRLFVAGRNLSSDLIYTQRPEKYVDLTLLPLKYEDVYGMLASTPEIFGSLMAETKADFAADIFYLSGGHPGLMAKIIERFRLSNLSPIEFIENYIDKYWSYDLLSTTSEVAQGLLTKKSIYWEFAERTVAFRYFNRSILHELFKSVAVEKVISETINFSGLYREGAGMEYATLFSGGGIRNLLSLNMLATQPKKYKEKCIEAQSLCLGEISNSIKSSEFMIEYLFLCLQESIADSNGKILNKRKSVRRKYERKIEEFVGKLAKVHRDKGRKEDIGAEFISALKRQADLKDGDTNKALFRFWIIYVYKEKSYSLDVYKNFVTNTEKLVVKHFGLRKT